MISRKFILASLAAIQMGACATTPPSTEKTKQLGALLDGQIANATPKDTGSLNEGITISELLPVYFEFDEPEIPEAELEKIKTVASYLNNQLQYFNIQLEGHADDRGSYDYNFTLGMERAANVAAILVSYDVHPYRIRVASYGEEFPEQESTTATARSLNRRVEFVILP